MIVDETWMSEERLERAWPPVSRDAAIIAFGPLALLVHFTKTVGHFRSAVGVLLIPAGFVLGVVALLIVLFGGGLILDLLFRMLGLPTE